MVKIVQFCDRGCVVKIVCTVLGQGMCGENSLFVRFCDKGCVVKRVCTVL